MSQEKNIKILIEKSVYDNQTDKFCTVHFNDYFCYDSKTYLNEVLNKYAPNNLPVCNNHINLDRNVRYIIRNGKVEWLIPSEECLLLEYLSTYPSEVLELEILSEIGATPVEIIAIISSIITIVMGAEWVFGKIARIKEYVKNFKNKKGQYIEEYDLKSFIQSKDEWNIDELMELLNVNDMQITVIILDYFGYSKSQNMYSYNPRNDKSDIHHTRSL